MPPKRVFPSTLQLALRHLSTVERDCTLISDVFCVGTSFKAIRRSYRKLAVMFHPDHHVARAKGLEAMAEREECMRQLSRCMMVLSRCWEIVKKEHEFHELMHGPAPLFHIKPNLKYTISQTSAEESLHLQEQEQMHREEMNEFNQRVRSDSTLSNSKDDVPRYQADEPYFQSENENKEDEEIDTHADADVDCDKQAREDKDMAERA